MNAKTLDEWDDVVADHASHMFSNHCFQVDIAFDQYRKKIIKSAACSKRVWGNPNSLVPGHLQKNQLDYLT